MLTSAARRHGGRARKRSPAGCGGRRTERACGSAGRSGSGHGAPAGRRGTADVRPRRGGRRLPGRQGPRGPGGRLVLSAYLTGEVFGPLPARDPADRGLLVSTLDAWLECGGSAARTADRLSCHRNTVLNRLRWLEELTSRSLSRPRELVEVKVVPALDAVRSLPGAAVLRGVRTPGLRPAHRASNAGEADVRPLRRLRRGEVSAGSPGRWTPPPAPAAAPPRPCTPPDPAPAR
ncbi:helix-turn-helix domain-containing protein [Streptomyces sp. NPDC048669]|uniref:helix-turn-helix domain-containing protein n=1 Tax=Streptomyces sp. NPDC048669 TaxID=3155267 RepID=UPI0034329394